MPPALDETLFLRRLENACEAAIRDFRAFPAEETWHRTSGKLDGLLHGAASVLMSLQLNLSSPLLEEARAVVERYRREISTDMESFGPHP